MLTYYLHVYQDGASIFQLYSYYAKNEINSFQIEAICYPPPPHFFLSKIYFMYRFIINALLSLLMNIDFIILSRYTVMKKVV